MLLADRTAVVYGGAGFVGRAVARAFAREGATVFLAGRRPERLVHVAKEITTDGGVARVAQVDASDDAQVQRHADQVVDATGGIDVWFNAIAYGDVQGAPLAQMAPEDVMGPVTTALRAHLVTVRAAAQRMVTRGSGVVLTITGYGPPSPSLGGTMVAWHTVESLYRQWASELGPAGVRVAWLRTGGFREAVLGADAYDSLQMVVDGALVSMSEYDAGRSPEDEVQELAEWTMLKRLPSLAEAGEAAVFLASDRAASITATGVNLTAGAVAD